MNNDDQYVPSDEDMESRYVLHSLSLFDFLPEEREKCTKALGAEFRRGLARVRRDAARQAEAERDEWRQTALDERAAALDALEQIKAREARIKAAQDALSFADMGETLVTRSRIRRALEG